MISEFQGPADVPMAEKLALMAFCQTALRMDDCTKCYRNPYNSCQDISLIATNVQLVMAQKEKS